MTLTPRLRKVALTGHVVSSVGWLGAVIAFLALAIAGLTSQDAQTVRAVYLAMDVTGAGSRSSRWRSSRSTIHRAKGTDAQLVV